MYRTLPLLLCLFCVVESKADEPPGLFEKIDRTIRHEPVYKSTPKYCLLLLGASGKVKVWMVEDGRQLYIDKNVNGDLTDDGPPIEPSNDRKLGDDHWDCNYLLDGFTAGDGPRVSDFNLRRWNYGGANDSYGLSLSLEGQPTKAKSLSRDVQLAKELTFSLNGQIPMYAGWFDTFWALNPAAAPAIHFGGALTPRMLREKEFVIGSGKRRLSLALMNPGSAAGAVSRLSIEAIPAHIVPKLTIKWPSDTESRSFETSHDLVDRCCYWEFYTTDFEVPDGIAVGTALVSVQFPGYSLPIELTTTKLEVPIVEAASKSGD